MAQTQADNGETRSIDGEQFSTTESVEEATHVQVTFHPQIWKGDRPVSGSEIRTFVIPFEAATDEDGTLVENNSHASDQLARHENAPKKASNWAGPFYVTLDELLVVEDTPLQEREQPLVQCPDCGGSFSSAPIEDVDGYTATRTLECQECAFTATEVWDFDYTEPRTRGE